MNEGKEETQIIKLEDLPPEQREAFDLVANEIIDVIVFHRATLKMVGKAIPVKHIGAFVKACIDKFKVDNPEESCTYADFAIVRVSFGTKNIQLQSIEE